MAENYDALGLVAKAELEYNVDHDDDQFPVGLHVLAVDDNTESRHALACLLSSCRYNVTTTRDAATAIEMLKKDPKSFDIVIADIHMMDMDGFDFIDTVHREMSIPVLMVLSESDGVGTSMEAMERGTCGFLSKPIRREEIQNIWQHVYRKYMMKGREPSSDMSMRSSPLNDSVGCSGSTTSQGELGHDIANYTDPEAREEMVRTKRARINWNDELHGKFMAAVNQLGGLEEAQPRGILRLMNMPHVSRGSVASHLQKCKASMKKKNQGSEINDSTLAKKAMLNWDRTANQMLTMPNHSRSAQNFSNLSWSMNPVSHEERRGFTPHRKIPLQDVYMRVLPTVPGIRANAATVMGESSDMNYYSDAVFRDPISEQIKTICSSMSEQEIEELEQLEFGFEGGAVSDSSYDLADELHSGYRSPRHR